MNALESQASEPFLFYHLDKPEPKGIEIPKELKLECWLPRAASPTPPGLGRIKGTAWLLFHLGRVFANRDYCAGIVRSGDRVVHITLVFPGFFRFPFMGRADLQFGDLWTDPDFRGKGLASATLNFLLAKLGRPNRRFWYITHRDNVASQHVAANQGFSLVGSGDKVPRAGLRFLGSYRILTHLPSAPK